ncbi:hypothetical protein [Arachidicoccus ginsenosidimutans]|uniref:hypothetical protein n=1 Tax=Arachidicoccus sp. BS20 TaxID=1850526 RepID=UPI0012E8B920|nr:hypothetical protein [Arachidicoccus sp. BS20]
MQAEKKHTIRKNSKVQKVVQKEEVIYFTKSEIPVGKSLFADKLKKVNEMLENAILMKH